MTLKTEMIAARCAHLSSIDIRLAWTRLGVRSSDIEGPPVGVLVGEMPPESMGRCLPLFPDPPGSAGGRLLKISGMPPAVYLGRFFRYNLFDEHCKWTIEAARERAARLRAWMLTVDGDLRVLVFGQRVGQAFGLDGFFIRRAEVHGEGENSRTHELVCIPHPSGLNTMYNDPEVRRATQAAMMWAAGLS